jgi:hypothetical protein
MVEGWLPASEFWVRKAEVGALDGFKIILVRRPIHGSPGGDSSVVISQEIMVTSSFRNQGIPSSSGKVL